MAKTAAIIGLGNMGREHLVAYGAAGIEVTHVCDFQFVKPEFDFLQSTDDWREVIGKTDFLSVASYDHCHAEQVIAGLEAGQAVFCEKPLCLTMDDFGLIEGMMEALEELKTRYPRPNYYPFTQRLGVNYPLRHVEKFKQLRRDIEDGKFGDIYFISATYHYGRRHKLDEWRADQPYSKMMGGGIHMADLVRWMTEEYLEFPDHPLQHGPVARGDFQIPHGFAQIIADFGSDRGDHWHEISIRGTKAEITVRNTDPTDKQACLKDFIAGYDDPTIFDVTEACLKMSR